MVERISRRDDENLYQPKIHADRIRELYRIRIITHIPLTVLLDMAIQEFVEKMDWEREEKLEYKPEDAPEPNNDDYEDLTTYLEPYQDNPYG